MIVAFELKMPRNRSWNNKWSGEANCYCILKTYKGKKQEERAKKIIDGGPYHHDFGDGWGARVDVREVSTEESRRLRKASNGFMGYEWMVQTILDYGEILDDLGLKRYVEQRRAEAIASEPPRIDTVKA